MANWKKITTEADLTLISSSLTTTDQAISASVAALSGSASDARNALSSESSSYALTSSHAITASYAGTASYAETASYALNSTTAINANDLIIGVKNTSGGTLTKGTPVYSTGVTGDNLNISAASASSAATMPAIGILSSTLNNNSSGQVILTGKMIGVDTSGFTAGNNIYVAPTGGFTETKPGGDSALIQNIAIVGKVNATEGELVVIGSGRSNDVPNLPTDYIFVGDGNTLQVPLADAITGSLPSGTVSGSVQVDITSTTGYTTFSSSLETTDQAISASVAALSGSASDARNELVTKISGSSTAAIAALSSSLTTTDQAISASVAALSGSASDARDLLGGVEYPSEYITGNTTAEKNKLYIFTSATAYILTLPASPTNGDTLIISDRSGLSTNTIARNGELIMGDAQDVVLNTANSSFRITYAAGSLGWIMTAISSGFSGITPYSASYMNGNIQGVTQGVYVFDDTGSARTLTLPATPNIGDTLKISGRSGLETNIIARNSELIMGSATDLTLNNANAAFELLYTSGSQGWVIIGSN